MCDEEDNCSYYDDYTQEVCIDEIGCYSPQDALTFYFATEEELAELFGIYSFRLEFMYEMAMEFRYTFEAQNVHFETEDEFYATFMPVFDQKWEELQISEDSEDWTGTWELLFEPIMEEFGLNKETFDNGASFNWEDWRSNFDMS
jgi:hypothetical protein